MYRRWDPHAMTGEAHSFSHLLLCLHPARPAPFDPRNRCLCTDGWFCNTVGTAQAFALQLAGFATQQVM